MTGRRSRARSIRGLPVALILLAVLLVGAMILPAASYSTGDVDRDVVVSVADDPNAVLAIEAATSVRTGHVDRLVVVTNDLGSTATVTVSLTAGAASKGKLVVNGTPVGDEYSATLAHAGSVELDINITDDDSYVGDDVVFDVTAETSSVDIRAPDRRVSIEDGGA